MIIKDLFDKQSFANLAMEEHNTTLFHSAFKRKNNSFSAQHLEHTRQTHKWINYAETVVLSWPDLTPVSSEIDLMAGWMPTKSFAPPLLIRRDGTILK